MATIVEFQDVKLKIRQALDVKAKTAPFAVTEGSFLLVDGFVPQQLQATIGREAGYQIGGGSTLPLVLAVGAKTGQVYYFPVKVLVPEIEF
jgi:hypothetical protein